MHNHLLPQATTALLTQSERRFRFHGLPEAAATARRALRGWEAQMEPELFYDLSLCVSALVTGSVQRRGPADRRAAELTVHIDRSRVRVDLAERNALQIGRPIPPDEAGIALVAGVADRWGVCTDSGRLEWCEIDLARDLRPARTAH